MVMRLWVFIFLLFSFFTSIAQTQTPPSNEEIESWWKPSDPERSAIESASILYENQDPIEIHLRNREVAYLVPVSISPSGRNFMFRMALVRPALQESREISDYIYSHAEVYDFDGDGVSEVVGVAFGSGGGTLFGEKSIVQFDGWNPMLLYQSDYHDTEGVCGKRCHRFSSKSLDWKFVDLDNNGVVDLLETVTTEEGRNYRDPIVTQFTYRWFFHENRFMRYHEYRQYAK